MGTIVGGRMLLLTALVGSRAYGLALPDSDSDKRGVFAAPVRELWGLKSPHDEFEVKAENVVYWEVKKYLHLALNGNPTILECLFSPEVEVHHRLGQLLLDNRGIFLSKRLYMTYGGYARSQMKRTPYRQGMTTGKMPMHALRLLLCGIKALRHGELTVQVEHQNTREMLLAVRRGELDAERVQAWYEALDALLEAAYVGSGLPDIADHAKAEEILQEIRECTLPLTVTRRWASE